jgi:hypothetical protein
LGEKVFQTGPGVSLGMVWEVAPVLSLVRVLQVTVNMTGSHAMPALLANSYGVLC